MNIALIAHDRMEDSLEALGRDFAPLLRAHRLMATGTTGGRLRDGAGLDVEYLLSGPLGGDLQIGSRIATGGVDLVIFLRDPMTPQPHEPDINALIRTCDVHNVPCVTNPAGARILLAQLAVFGWMTDNSAVMEPAAAATPIGMVEPIVVVAPVSVPVPVPERAHEFDPVSVC